MMEVICPLCGSVDSSVFLREHDQIYYRCHSCQLTFLSPAMLPSIDEERARYDTHNNSLDDHGYRQFQLRLVKCMLPLLEAGAHGLDFGCGPVPIAANIFAENNHPTKYFDPIYFPDSSLLKEHYNFISAIEVAEHFHKPAEMFIRLDQMLLPGAHLGIMTYLLDDDRKFANWWYRRDLTHVCFYKRETLWWIAHWRAWEVRLNKANVTVFRKPGDPPNQRKVG